MLIQEIFIENKEKFENFLLYSNILNKKEPETEEEKMKFLSDYGENIKKDKFYSGAINSHSSNFLMTNINVLYKEALFYKSLNYYKSQVEK